METSIGSPPSQPEGSSFFARHDFLIRRLHSLSGLIPVGAYMCVHLAVNASVNDGASAFQENVYNIHKLGALLPVVEWTFIFIPILFHAIVGVAIVAGGLPNSQQYPYGANRRYTLQRQTGIIAFVFIFLHVFHMHGWFNHSESWMANVVRPLGGGKFDPFRATSTAGEALAGVGALSLYVIGVLACVFHLANGIWTMGITWGVWTSASAQRRALWACGAFGVLLGLVGLSSVFGMRNAVSTPQRLQAVKELEQRMLEHQIEAGLVEPDHGGSSPDAPHGDGLERKSNDADADKSASAAGEWIGARR